MESVSNSTSSNRKYGLTANGNQYKKCNIAKNIGTGIGVAQTAGMTAMAAGGRTSNTLFCCGLGIVGALVYRAIGTLVDNSINKNRMAQADGEAALRNKMQNGEVVA